MRRTRPGRLRMTPEQSKRVKLLASALSVLVVVAAIGGSWFYSRLRASLPRLDGAERLDGLGAPVTVTRDALGIPTVHGRTRQDVARALGFLHAQDRFFQMDTLRRRAAGELAEVFGEAVLASDRRTRPHHFRALAVAVLGRLPAADRALLEAYTAGVNAGLARLGSAPFEYLLMRARPAPWRPEDSLLVIYAMTLELQDADNGYEHSLTTLRDAYGNAAVAFFAPLLTPDDGALDDTRGAPAPVPGPRLIDLRAPPAAAPTGGGPALARASLAETDLRPGSNSFAASGAHTAHGGAMLANDPHLQLGVPNIWYRAVLAWPGEGAAGHRLVGATLPGLPFVVLGSNGQVAWGLTDAYADTSDLVAVELHPKSPDLYLLPGNPELQTVETRRDVIAVKGGSTETVETRWTHWGRIVGTDDRGRALCNHWTAYDPDALNLEFRRLEDAPTVAVAIDIAHRAGMPAQNFVVADAAGSVGWTIIGRLPRRIGFDGRLPASWLYGDRRWDGFVPPGEVPAIVVPAVAAEAALAPVARAGWLWSANNRVVGADALARIGDGGYAAPARAIQIRGDLEKLQRVRPPDLLQVQLDDRAEFLARWHRLMQEVLTPAVAARQRSRETVRELLTRWEGRAAVEAVSYRLVRAFRQRVAALVFDAVFARCVEANPQFDWRRFNYEPALWTLVQQRPLHLLPAKFASWDDLLATAVDEVVTAIEHDGPALKRATWGAVNRARITHPIGGVLPSFLSGWLNLPADPLPGDSYMPRVQSPTFGASLRLVVAPGREDEGLCHMPGGQSGHPLSPFYRAGHEAWVRGEPSPLLPGPARHTLLLQP